MLLSQDFLVPALINNAGHSEFCNDFFFLTPACDGIILPLLLKQHRTCQVWVQQGLVCDNLAVSLQG